MPRSRPTRLPPRSSLRTGEEENVRYTLRFDADAEETKVTVLAPELLAGVTAHLAADTLKLEYDGLVLDAGGTP